MTIGHESALATGTYGSLTLLSDGRVRKSVLDARNEWMVRHEYAILKYLGVHKNIVSVLNVEMSPWSFTMEYGGMDLLDAPLHNVETVCSIATQLFDALTFLRERHVAHLDLKLENLLLDEHGTLRVVDFGLSQYLPSQTRLPRPVGSRAYCAPELFVAGMENDAFFADVWSYGIILFALFIKAFPWTEALEHVAAFNHFKASTRSFCDWCTVYRRIRIPDVCAAAVDAALQIDMTKRHLKKIDALRANDD